MCRCAFADQLFIIFIWGPQIDGIGRNPVAAFAENAGAVDLEEEVAAFIRQLGKVDGKRADTDFLRFCFMGDAACRAACGKGIKVLSTVTVRPPELCIL